MFTKCSVETFMNALKPPYPFVCSELIEETGRFSNVIFWHIGVTFGTRQQVEVSTQNFSHLDKL